MEEVSTLQEKTKEMKNSMTAMGDGAERINATGDALSEISTLMEGSIAEIGKQVDQFQV
jgi:methyl-accepting chemotaxis protein